MADLSLCLLEGALSWHKHKHKHRGNRNVLFCLCLRLCLCPGRPHHGVLKFMLMLWAPSLPLCLCLCLCLCPNENQADCCHKLKYSVKYCLNHGRRQSLKNSTIFSDLFPFLLEFFPFPSSPSIFAHETICIALPVINLKSMFARNWLSQTETGSYSFRQE